MAQTPRSRKTLPEVIADRLQREILDSGARPNDRLSTEAELVARYGVSRTVVREAVRLLVQRGLVSVKPGRGMVVAEFDGKLLAEQFAVLMRASNGTFDQLLELRLAIEVQMAILAAKRQPEHLISAMQETIDRGEASVGDRERFLEADMDFHELLAESSGNPFFDLVSKPINQFMRSHYRNRESYPSDPLRTLEEHTEILNAIRRGDTFGARHATEEHLRRLMRARRNAAGAEGTALAEGP